MSNITGPLFIGTILWMAAFRIAGVTLKAIGLGTVHDPMTWWAWCLVWITVYTMEIAGQRLARPTHNDL